MGKSKVDKMILAGESSVQCCFCDRILFTDTHVKSVMASGRVHCFDGSENTVDESGYCKECREAGYESNLS